MRWLRWKRGRGADGEDRGARPPGERPLALGVFLAASLVNLAGQVISQYPAIHGDGHYTYLWARSIAFDGDLDLANDYDLCGDPWRKRAPIAAGLGPQNTWGVGAAVVWAPLLAVARLVPTGAAEPEVVGACRGPRAEFAMIGSALAAAAAVALAFRMARRHLGTAPAALGAAGAALATPLLFYATAAPSYSHAISAFAVALFIERWDAWRATAGAARWPLLGALLGLAMLVRAQNALLALLPAAEWIHLAVARGRERRWRALGPLVAAGAALGATAALVFVPQMLAWKKGYGEWLVTPQGPHYMRWGAADVDGVLFSEAGGVLAWNPVLYFAAGGLIAALWRPRLRWAAAGALAVVAIATYVNAAVWDFTGNGGFPNRRFADLALPFAFGLSLAAAGGLALAQRHPRAFAVAALALPLAGCALWTQVVIAGGGYDGREDAWATPIQRGLGRLATGTWSAVGNPLSWPASLPFAIRHRAHPRQHDFMHGITTFFREPYTRSVVQDTVELGSDTGRRYLAGGFDDRGTEVASLPATVTATAAPRARMLLPTFHDDFAGVEVTVAAPGGASATSALSLRWNGQPAGPASVTVIGEWRTHFFPVPRGAARRGVNQAEWTISGAPVAFHRLRFLETPPTPPPPDHLRPAVR